MRLHFTPIWLGINASVVGATLLLQAAPQGAPSASPTVATASRGRRVFAAGTVEGMERSVPLRFNAAGSLRTIHVREGDQIERGSVIACLGDETWKCRVSEASARLTLARAEASRLANGSREETRAVARTRVRAMELKREQARIDVERIQRLFQQSATTERDRIAANNQLALAAAECAEAEAALAEIAAPARADDLKIAQAKVVVAQSELQLAQAALDETVLRAPNAGTILRVNVSAGETTHPLAAEPVVVMADTSATRVRAYVEELDAMALNVGDQACVMADGRGTVEHPGRLLWIAPSMQAKAQSTGKPKEHFDVAVREVVVGLESVTDFPIGLPVEVYIEPCREDESAGRQQTTIRRRLAASK